MTNYHPAPPPHPNGTPTGPTTWRGQPVNPHPQPPQNTPSPQPSGHTGASEEDPSTKPTKKQRKSKGPNQAKKPGTTRFAVPPPGGKARPGRKLSWGVRTGILVGSLVFVGGSTLTAGVLIGSSRIPADNELNAVDIAQYGLTEFPADAASAFGSQYLTTCLTYPDSRNEQAKTVRTATLNQMTSRTVTEDCGWNSQGSTQTPANIAFTGNVEPFPAATGNEGGRAAFVDYIVTYSDGRITTVTVPIWTNGTHQQPGAMRVIGDLGFMPAPRIAPEPNIDRNRNTDDELAGSLRTQVITPFLAAWGASNAVQLDLSVTSDATPAARNGLGGTLSKPNVQSVTAYVPPRDSDDPKGYANGDTAEADVNVVWSSNGGEHETGYRISLRKDAGKWSVTDIQGANVGGNTSGR